MAVEEIDINSEFQKIGMCMRVLATVDITGILETIEMAHTLGPFIDPTKYRDALYRGDMDEMAKVASLLREPIKHWNEKIAPKLKD